MSPSTNKQTNAGYITDEERRLIPKLREAVQDELVFGEDLQNPDDQDLFLVRWLRARELNLEKAVSMLRTSLNWRKENDVENALDFQIDPVLKKNFHFEFAGADKFGHPILLMRLEHYDARIIVDGKKYFEFDQFVINFFEHVVERIRFHNEMRQPDQPPITQFTVVSNFKNYPYAQLLNLKAFKKILQIASVYEAHYPELLFKAILINCPYFINMFLGLLRTVTAKRTMDKIDVYSSMDSWKRDMSKIMDPLNLPEDFGGDFDF